MGSSSKSFINFHRQFHAIAGETPQLSLCMHTPEAPYFHEAGVYIESSGELFVTSNRHVGSGGEQGVFISKISTTGPYLRQDIAAPGISMAAGGISYRDGVLFCAQGDHDHAGGLVYMDAKAPHEAEVILSSFHGVPFNSVNDAVVAEDGAIWFTDPIYGYEQGYRGYPKLPSQIYRYDVLTKSIRAVADGFGRPNGIAFSPDGKILYITVGLAFRPI